MTFIFLTQVLFWTLMCKFKIFRGDKKWEKGDAGKRQWLVIPNESPSCHFYLRNSGLNHELSLPMENSLLLGVTCHVFLYPMY